MLAKIYVPNQEFTSLVSPEESLVRGSSFENLYIPYKYIGKTILKGNTKRQNLLALIDIYSFMIKDLTLFKATHPNCKTIDPILSKAKIELSKLTILYNETYTSLTMDAIGKNYMEGPWPWEDLF